MDPINISYVIPVYNAEQTISNCVRSIEENSEYCYEIILINDGSLDRSLEVMRNLQKKNPYIKVIDFQDNKGISEALNAGIKEACGQFIFRLDADDTNLPNRESKQIRFMQKMQLHFCGGGAIVRSGDKELKKISRPVAHNDIVTKIRWVNCFIHPTVAFDAAIKDIFLYNKNFDGIEDYELFRRLLLDNSLKSGNIADPVINYSICETGRKWNERRQALSNNLIFGENFFSRFPKFLYYLRTTMGRL